MARRVKKKANARRTRAKSKRAVVRKSAKRVKSRFALTANPIKRRFGNRFEKFYYMHRNAINAFRRAAYKASKLRRVCVKCSKKRVTKSIFCEKHRRLSRVYNRRR